ncbi:glycosyltransferase family 4 protein [Pontibacter sp. SGAir0037]|uniref:glycosyltransferase family 4 protein n=1 Tax=Pontibacter sp. SGAir0037 TaxID=2571030 RepID=UPI0010CD0221|nr:glycosyltransferase family 4 protein [Pontibacter sp. SGAir0037]QCR22599.1 hypothetical protein C1N53_09785 [Pontibacter sp. SGAir0037]
MKVLVSNPFKAYAHQLSYALQQVNSLSCFATSVWYTPNSFDKQFSLIPSFLRNKLAKQFRRRSFDKLNTALVITYPIPELIRQIMLKFGFVGERWFFYVERIHDNHVANKLSLIKPGVVVGYEKASLQTFRKAREMGITTILDLAQVHFRHIEAIDTRYGILKGLIDSPSLLKRINRIKEEEYRYADYILVLSEYAKQTLLQEGVPGNKVKVANLGFDPNRFQLKKKFPTQGTFRLLFVGSVMRRKGIELLLKAFKELALADTELVIIGAMGDASDIMEQYKGSYTYIPFLTHDELVKHYQQADLFVFPSYLDSWAMVVLEAMACGTPVVVTENTGAKEAVKKGGGSIIPIHDLEAIKQEVLFYYYNRDQVEELGRRAAAIASEYTWKAYYSQVVTNISECSKETTFQELV